MNFVAAAEAELISLGPLSRAMTIKTFSTNRIDRERQAEEILRSRMLRGAGYSEKDIQWAVEVVRQKDPNHSLLRYSERGPIKSDPTE